MLEVVKTARISRKDAMDSVEAYMHILENHPTSRDRYQRLQWSRIKNIFQVFKSGEHSLLLMREAFSSERHGDCERGVIQVITCCDTRSGSSRGDPFGGLGPSVPDSSVVSTCRSVQEFIPCRLAAATVEGMANASVRKAK